MPCAVVFGATNEVRHYVVLKKTAQEVAVALGRARDEFGEFEDENGEALYYERAAPLWQSYRGLRRYWDKAAA